MLEWLTGRQKSANTRIDNASTQRFLRGLDLEDSSDLRVRTPYTQNIVAFRCITTISTSLADIPFTLLRNGKENIGAKGEAIRALFDAPNHLMDWNEFLTTLVVQLLVYGNAFAYIEEDDSNGIPLEILPIPASRVSPRRGKFLYDLEGWDLKTGPNTIVPVPFEKMIHIIYAPNPDDPVLGVSPIQVGMNAFETDLAASIFNKAMLSGGGLPSGLLRYTGQGKISEDMKEEIMQSWRRTYGGPRSGGNRLAITSGEWSYQPMGISHKEMEYIDMRKYNTIDIARLYNVPLIYLNEFEGIGFGEAGLAVLKKMFFDSNLIPLGTKFESAFNSQLISKIDKSLRGSFDFSNVDALKEDFEKLVEAAQRLQKMGFTINSINKRLKLGLEDMPWGDEYFLPMNMTTAQDVVDHNVVAPGGKGDGIPDNNTPTQKPNGVVKPEDKPADTTTVTKKAASARWPDLAEPIQTIEHQCESKLRKSVLAIRPQALNYVDSYLGGKDCEFEINLKSFADSITPYIIEAYGAGVGASCDEMFEQKVSVLAGNSSYRNELTRNAIKYADKRYSDVLELIGEFSSSIKRHIKIKTETGAAPDAIKASLKKVFNEFTNEAGRISKMEIYSAYNTARYRAFSELSNGDLELAINPRRLCVLHENSDAKIALGSNLLSEYRSECDCILVRPA